MENFYKTPVCKTPARFGEKSVRDFSTFLRPVDSVMGYCFRMLEILQYLGKSTKLQTKKFNQILDLFFLKYPIQLEVVLK